MELKSPVKFIVYSILGLTSLCLKIYYLLLLGIELFRHYINSSISHPALYYMLCGCLSYSFYKLQRLFFTGADNERIKIPS